MGGKLDDNRNRINSLETWLLRLLFTVSWREHRTGESVLVDVEMEGQLKSNGAETPVFRTHGERKVQASYRCAY